jgi:uncharacterized membrane protein
MAADFSAEVVVAIVGMIATAFVGGLGLFYTAKTKNNYLKEALFHRQLDLIVNTSRLYGRIRVNFVLLTDQDADKREFAADNIHKYIHELSKLDDEVAVLLPVEMFCLYKDILSRVHDCADNPADEEKNKVYLAQTTKFLILSRELTGADSLSEANLGMFSNNKVFHRATKLTPDDFKHLFKKQNDGS